MFLLLFSNFIFDQTNLIFLDFQVEINIKLQAIFLLVLII